MPILATTSCKRAFGVAYSRALGRPNAIGETEDAPSPPTRTCYHDPMGGADRLGTILATIMAEAQTQYDLVIVDSPTCLRLPSLSRWPP
jgi:hypothetical protein